MSMTLVHHWKLDETTGTTAYDSVGSNDGFVVGGMAWITEEPYGATFNGIAGYVTGTAPNCITHLNDGSVISTAQSKDNYTDDSWHARFRCEGDGVGGCVFQLLQKQTPEGEPTALGSTLSVYVGTDGLLYLYLRKDDLSGVLVDYWTSANRVDDGAWHQVIVKVCGVWIPELSTKKFYYSMFLDGAVEVDEEEAVNTYAITTAAYFHIGGITTLTWGGACGAEIASVSAPDTTIAFRGDIRDVRWYTGCASVGEIETLFDKILQAGTGAYVLSGGPITVHLSMAAQTAAYIVDGQPARLIADVVTPPEVEPNPIWFSCNT